MDRSTGWTWGADARRADSAGPLGEEGDSPTPGDERSSRSADHLTHAWYVMNLVEREGVPLDRAVRRAAIRYGVAEATIRRHYEDHADAVTPARGGSDQHGNTSLAGAPGRRAVWCRRTRETEPI